MEALMDDDDIEELLEFPIGIDMYWDSRAKCLKLDKEASKVSNFINFF